MTIKKIFVRNIKGIIFCGKNMLIEHGYLLHSKSGLIIEEGVYINALSV